MDDSYLIPISRAARIIAPIESTLHGDYFRAGVNSIACPEWQQSRGEIRIREVSPAPTHAIFDGMTLQSREWHIARDQAYSDGLYRSDPTYEAWMHDFRSWIDNDQLLVSRSDVEAHLMKPYSGGEVPVENVNAAGASWNFPETLAWIATRDPVEVTRMRCCSHFAALHVGEDSRRYALGQSDIGRTALIGWLAIVTARNHCRSGSVLTDTQEQWESCQCVGNAYVELARYANGTNHPIPEYIPKPAYGYFTLSWPEGAHNLKFVRDDVIANWPASDSPLETQSEERLCKDWLRALFAAQSVHERQNKDGYMKEAQTRFQGLSGRGFGRAWDAVAPQYEMNKAGRKKKQSVHPTS